METRGNLALFLEVAKLLGLQEAKKMTDDQSLILRLLTPLLKLYNGKMVPLKNLTRYEKVVSCFTLGCAFDKRRVRELRRHGVHGGYRVTITVT